MPVLILLLLPVAEIYTMVQVSYAIGGFNALALVILTSFTGAAIVKTQSTKLARDAQEAVAQGQAPQTAPMHSILILFGGVLLMIPGFVSDVIGLLFILPGTRHLIAKFAQGWIARQMSSGRIRFFGAGSFGPNGFQGFTRSEQDGPGEFTRDVSPRVIDVTPTSVTKTEVRKDETD